jgi:hypothetical protein
MNDEFHYILQIKELVLRHLNSKPQLIYFELILERI